MSRSLKPDLKEFAPPAPDPWAGFLGTRRLADHIVRSDGFAGHSSPYVLFEEMEDKDAHLSSLLQTRKLGVLARPRKVDAAESGARAQEIAQWVDRALTSIPGWNGALMHLLDALGKGLAVAEIMWGFDREGRLVPREIKPRAAERFSRGAAGEWRVDETPSAAGRMLPPRKFVIALSGATDERPYGKGLCEKLYWYWWFKKNNIKFWLVFNEKFGAPTIVAQHPSGLNDRERERLIDVIDAIQTDAGVTIPEGIRLELLESKRSAAGDTFRSLSQWCNDEMSRAVLGQTLTSSEGARSGSLALGEVHNEIRRDYMRADAWLLMDVVNEQLVRPLVELNFGMDVPAPRWSIDLSPELDLTAEVGVDRQLLQKGDPLPERYFYEKYGRPAPLGGDSKLQYDDSNVYQYHLQFGILTVNEVRAKLGLAPVGWGERPTSPVDTSINTSTPGGATGEDTREQEDESENEEKKMKGQK
ncbi:DUF935 domain-containing protein [bacterium]|nr:DUF935 domain-containing protein [bacterium]